MMAAQRNQFHILDKLLEQLVKFSVNDTENKH